MVVPVTIGRTVFGIPLELQKTHVETADFLEVFEELHDVRMLPRNHLAALVDLRNPKDRTS